MIRQLEWDSSIEHFIPQAVIGKAPNFFEAERGITFTSSHDGLGYFRGALLSTGDEILFHLKQYRGARPNTTVIYLDPKFSELDFITETVRRIVSDLGLAAKDVLWERKDSPSA